MTDRFQRIPALGRADTYLGQALLWLWVDCFFMGVPLEAFDYPWLQEAAVIVLFAGSGIMNAISIVREAEFLARLQSQKTMLAVGLAGTLAVALSMALAAVGLPIASLAAILVAGFVLGVQLVAWGLSYSSQGIKSASVMVPMSFLLACIGILALLSMAQPLRMAVSALLPFLSAALFVKSPGIETGRVGGATVDGQHDEDSIRALVGRVGYHAKLPVSFALASLVFMIAFGFAQHVFASPLAGIGSFAAGMVLQVARGMSAAVILICVLLVRNRESAVYRAGFYVMILGYMVIPYLALFPEIPYGHFIMAAIVMLGYTCFDVFLWNASAEISYVSEIYKARSLASARLVVSLGLITGLILGWLTDGMGLDGRVRTAVTISLTFALTIATTVFLSNTSGLWGVIRAGALRITRDSFDEEMTESERLSSELMCQCGLTERERQIAEQILQGRSAERIADALSISRNTVLSHTRKIYSKAGVHSKQELIDLAQSTADHGS